MHIVHREPHQRGLEQLGHPCDPIGDICYVLIDLIVGPGALGVPFCDDLDGVCWLGGDRVSNGFDLNRDVSILQTCRIRMCNSHGRSSDGAFLAGEGVSIKLHAAHGDHDSYLRRYYESDSASL